MISTLTFSVAGMNRYALLRTDLSAAPRALDVVLHGGGGLPGASDRMVKRWAASPGVIGVFPEGSPTEPGAVGWHYPEEVHGRPAETYDAEFLHALMLEAAGRYPGVPIRLVGYSAGAGMLQALVRWKPLPVPVAAWALLKNTPVVEWISPDGKFVAPYGLPPDLAIWWATGDTVARQNDLGHVDADTMWAVWAATYDETSPPQPTITRCGRIGVELDRMPSLFFATEIGGSHAVIPCTGTLVDRWFDVQGA